MSQQTDNWQTLVKEQQYNDLLMEWNSKINLVSRQKKNVLDLIEDAKLFLKGIEFTPGMNILDLGTGGGIPGVILAIYHPEVNFVPVDSIQKKINVVTDIVKRMELVNVKPICGRAEELVNKGILVKHSFDYVVSRSVAVLQDLCTWSKDLVKPGGKIVTLKGGDISGEIQKTRKLPFIKNVSRAEYGERILVTAEFI